MGSARSSFNPLELVFDIIDFVSKGLAELLECGQFFVRRFQSGRTRYERPHEPLRVGIICEAQEVAQLMGDYLGDLATR